MSLEGRQDVNDEVPTNDTDSDPHLPSATTTPIPQPLARFTATVQTGQERPQHAASTARQWRFLVWIHLVVGGIGLVHVVLEPFARNFYSCGWWSGSVVSDAVTCCELSQNTVTLLVDRANR